MLIGGNYVNEETAVQVGEWWIDDGSAYGPDGEVWDVEDGKLCAQVMGDEKDQGHGWEMWDSPQDRTIPLPVVAMLLKMSEVTL